MNNLRIKRHPSAFTLIELLTVITIIGILASMSFPVVTGVMRSVVSGIQPAFSGTVRSLLRAMADSR